MNIYSKKITWVNPLLLSSYIQDSEDYWVLLFSGKNSKALGRYSYLSLKPVEYFQGENFEELKKLREKADTYFGFISYDLLDHSMPNNENLVQYIDVPGFCLVKFDIIFKFDHIKKELTVYYATPEDLNHYIFKFLAKSQFPIEQKLEFKIDNFSSNMTKNEYLEKVQTIREYIIEGEVYQANLTRKFYGTIETKNNYFDFFKKLSNLSPASYSAYLKLADLRIASYSPEQFLSIKNGRITTTPIKGTAPRYDNFLQDHISRINLRNSSKELAENLMITDLMRNDLSKTCNKVKLKELFQISTHANLHHISSVICAKIKKGFTVLDSIMACFPAGSITGAPKYSAIKICSVLEKYKRGVYTGAIGLLNPQSFAELSVAIRTIVFKGNKFEFQVGGGVVIDSIPELEYQETLIKMKALLDLLQINVKVVDKL